VQARPAELRHEQSLRRNLWRLGLRYRKQDATLPGTPDIVFSSARVAIFCDDDFWHGRKWTTLRRRMRKIPETSDAAYWIEQIKVNVHRDAQITAQLESQGWRVIRVWQGDIWREPFRIAMQIQKVVEARIKKAKS
jgi:DNA mismatch endonuclease (patch repair protein)